MLQPSSGIGTAHRGRDGPQARLRDRASSSRIPTTTAGPPSAAPQPSSVVRSVRCLPSGSGPRPLGGVLLPFVVAVGAIGVSAATQGIALSALLLGEPAERSLFFASVSLDTMPGTLHEWPPGVRFAIPFLSGAGW